MTHFRRTMGNHQEAQSRRWPAQGNWNKAPRRTWYFHDLLKQWQLFYILLVQFLHLSIAKVISPRDWNSIHSLLRVCIVYSPSDSVAYLTWQQATWWYFIAQIFSRYCWDTLFPHARHTVESDFGHILSELPNPLNFCSKMEQQQPVTYSLVRTASNPRSGKPSWQRRHILPNQRGEEQRLQIAWPLSIRCGAVQTRTAPSYQPTGFELNILAIVFLRNLCRSV